MNPEHMTGRERGTAALLIASTALAVCVLNTETRESALQTINDIKASFDARTSCIEPSVQDTAAVESWLAKPQLAYDGAHKSDNKANKDDTYYRQAARLSGVELAPNSIKTVTEIRKLSATASFDELLDTANKFTQQLGFTINVGERHNPGYDNGARQPTTAELQTELAKENLVNLVGAYATIPKEYTAMAGLQHIYLVAGMNPSLIAYTWAQRPDGGIYIDITKSISMETEMHELYHRIDNAECGKATSDDPAFAAFNDGQQVYNGVIDDDSVPNVSIDFEQAETGLRNSMYYVVMPGQANQYCARLNTLSTEAAKTLTWSTYHPAVQEDKAEIGAQIPLPDSFGIAADAHFGIVHQKFTYLLARLHAMNPAVAQYFIMTGGRPDKSQFSDWLRCSSQS